MDLKTFINNHYKLFQEMCKGFPPTRGHDHAIHLQPRIVAPNISPYKYSHAQKSEIKHMVQEMLKVFNLDRALSHHR